MAESACPTPLFGSFTSASRVVTDELQYFTNLVNRYVGEANAFSQMLEDYSIDPIVLPPIQWDENLAFVSFEEPEDPGEFVAPPVRFGDAPPGVPNISDIDTGALDAVQPPTAAAPIAPVIFYPPPPVLNLPPIPDNAPVVGNTDIPLYVGGPLPPVPTLISLNLPPEPDINLADLVIERPEFIQPGTLQDLYRPDVVDYQNLIWTGVDANVGSTGVYDMHGRLTTMLAGGTGLPPAIEQALFNRAIGREEVSATQAIVTAETEWSAKGFALPGATLLARVQEIRHENRKERGRINREISIQFHTQEIENLRFAVQNAIALEGQLFEAHTRIFDLAKQCADGHWVVMKGIYDSAIAMFGLHLEIYKTDVEVYNSLIQVELSKLEVYKSQLEGQRLIGTLNQQYVDIYKAELDGFLAGVEVYKAEVQGAEAAIRAELTKVEVYKAEIEAYSAFLEGEKIKTEVYTATVGAEEIKAKVYEAQVGAYTSRIAAYKTNIDAEASKVDAKVRIVESTTQNYTASVQGWNAGIQADVASLNGAVEVYKVEIDKYTALLSAEQYRITGESRNFELSLQQQQSEVQALLKQADQSIEQLKHISTQSLAATEIATKVNSQLASSAMSAISIGASFTQSSQSSASDTRSCNTNYSASISAD